MIIKHYENLPASFQAYDHRAPTVAFTVATLIRFFLPAVCVEHIGSTAVPGCAGKGIIDLMTLYPQGELQSAKTLLDKLGFQPQSTPDPFPEERPMRVGALKYAGKIFYLHVHVLSACSPEAEMLRLFRDKLRTDEELRQSYVGKKQAIILSGITDPVDYCYAKGAFIEATLLQ